VSTSNQKALVWNLATKTSQDSVEHVLHAHSRAITDINFSAHHPDVLATCAVDSFVHCWDLRIPARPVVSFSDWFAGATQVKWNRQDPHVIASSHDRWLRIWDDRKGASPLRSIDAHDTKIYGIDWNRIRPTALITCSLDKTIKFWDYKDLEDKPERVIDTPFPVWRARHTPFGWGVLAMPQRDSNDLHLYDRRVEKDIQPPRKVSPVHSFEGHKGQVKEFLWRPRGTIVDGIDHREFQLVSWGGDKELRLHRVTPAVLESVGFDKGKTFTPTVKLTRKNAKYRTFRDEVTDDDYQEILAHQPEFSPAPGQPFSARSRGSLSVGMSKVAIPHVRGWIQGAQATSSRIGMHGRNTNRPDLNPITWMRGVKIAGWDNIETLGDEITYVGERFTKVRFEVADVQRRRATVELHGPWGADGGSLFLKLDIKFPHDYPRGAIPIFHIQKTSSMTDQLATKISSGLQAIADMHMSANRGSLEAILLYLLGERGLEDSLALVSDSPDHESKIAPGGNDLSGDVSSDEDDEVVGTFQAQEMDLSTSELLRPVNANVNVPVAKACGAVWADNGRLVCFFPPKTDKLVSVFGSLGLKELDRTSRSDRIFEGFGRLQAASPGPRKTAGTSTTLDDGASDASDDSDSTSSSSSGSSDLLTSLPNRFQSQGFRQRTLGLQRSHSAENSQRSTTAVSTLKSASTVPRNVVSIHNFEDLVPSKRILAKQYRIFGSGPEICAHNADVAARHGDQDLAQVWNLIKLVLFNQVPLEALPLPQSSHHVVVIAQQAWNQLKRKDSGVDLSFDVKAVPPKVSKAGRVRWGGSPLGGRWLVPALSAPQIRPI
jgi:WD repeat-containing protein 59